MSPLRILSLGAGVQSSTLALMIARGEIEPVECAIFADTGDEPTDVYRYLDYLKAILPFPVHRVSAGRLSDSSTTVKTAKSGNTYLVSMVPAHIARQNASKGMQVRHCTRNHKIDPINRKVRELAVVPRGCKTVMAQVLVGISLDEAIRMKPSQKTWIENTWPLVERRITRQQCLDWMDHHGYPRPPRSACVFCPYHSDAEWTRLKTNDPDGFLAAVRYEARLQESYRQASALDGVPYLHSTLRPLDEVDFTADRQVDMFGNECEGICGV